MIREMWIQFITQPRGFKEYIFAFKTLYVYIFMYLYNILYIVIYHYIFIYNL